MVGKAGWQEARPESMVGVRVRAMGSITSPFRMI
jgi:hypothetical protein